MDENSYGFKKRLNFIEDIIQKNRPRKVLDIGCGTAENVTIPLSKLFPSIKFTAVDNDVASVEHARFINENQNLEILHDSEFTSDDKFDMVIASEVLEHVTNPIEFLDLLRRRLSSSGKMIVTLPNGYGPFEIASLIEIFFYFLGGYFIIRILKFYLVKKTIKRISQDTLANSPHINFFKYKDMSRIFSLSGLNVSTYKGRTFLCGFGFDKIFRSQAMLEWNARVADKISPSLISAWMFELTPTNPPCNVTKYQNSFYGRLRADLNRLRWKV